MTDASLADPIPVDDDTPTTVPDASLADPTDIRPLDPTAPCLWCQKNLTWPPGSPVCVRPAALPLSMPAQTCLPT